MISAITDSHNRPNNTESIVEHWISWNWLNHFTETLFSGQKELLIWGERSKGVSNTWDRPRVTFQKTLKQLPERPAKLGKPSLTSIKGTKQFPNSFYAGHMLVSKIGQHNVDWEHSNMCKNHLGSKIHHKEGGSTAHKLKWWDGTPQLHHWRGKAMKYGSSQTSILPGSSQSTSQQVRRAHDSSNPAPWDMDVCGNVWNVWAEPGFVKHTPH